MPHDSPSPLPRLAITLGDPAGIGPEVILKALANRHLDDRAALTVVGDRALLQRTYQQLQGHHGQPIANPARLNCLDVGSDAALMAEVKTGVGSAASGALSFAYVQTAIAHTLAGQFDAIVTAPIAKSAWKLAGHEYPGQTELLAEQAGVSRFGMLFVARSPHTNWTFRTLLATTHIPLCQVPQTLTPDLMTDKLDLLVECLRDDFGIAQPRIAIAGLNPHSGEQGQLGREEQDWLIPWLEQTRQRLPDCYLAGPVPPDTLWVQPGQHWYGHPTPTTPYDGYLALYHDQGLIPVKLLAFDRAVNTTIGLPFIRTSPDHGTAFDIAGRGFAQAHSMIAAIQLAVELAQHRLGVCK